MNKVWLQKDVDKVEPGAIGIESFPPFVSFGSYCSFDSKCVFGVWCSFGIGCSFGSGCCFDLGCSFESGCIFESGCNFGMGCSFALGCKAISPFWPFVYEPPFEVEGRIYPTEDCRVYWSERLGIDLDGLCYSSIGELIIPKLDELLKLDKWTKCERRILESWSNNEI